MSAVVAPAPVPPVVTDVRPADLERRLHAYALDRLPGWGLPLALGWVLATGQRPTWLVVLAPVLLGVVLVLAAAALLSTRGATPGMSALGLAVRAVDGELGFATAVRRQAVLALAGLPTFGLGLATLAWTAAADRTGRRRGWHDEVAGTVVVDVRPVPEPDAAPERPQPIVNLTAMRLMPPEPAPVTPRPDEPIVPTSTPAPPTPPPPGRRRAEAPPATRTPAPPPEAPAVDQPPRRAARPEPRWRATADTGESVLVRGLTLLGRGPQAGAGEQVADLVALASEDMSVSKTHAQLVPGDDGSLVAMDRGSTNGSVLIRAGVPRHLSPGRPVTVLDGDILRLGDRVVEISREG